MQYESMRFVPSSRGDCNASTNSLRTKLYEPIVTTCIGMPNVLIAIKSISNVYLYNLVIFLGIFYIIDTRGFVIICLIYF